MASWCRCRTRSGGCGCWPFQRVLAPERARLTIERRRTETDGLDAGLAEEAGRPFDLASATPLRATAFELPDMSVVLALVLHHIATDGLSNGIFFADLERAYAARAAGGGSVLEPLAVRYADYAAWQRRVLGPAGARPGGGVHAVHGGARGVGGGVVPVGCGCGSGDR
ncbi:condensation domain-containing protein, partial [Streptomyces wedmorensis]|uniref:condensation domain-containing protein n=1 Tax=Streptomyces wedmorensis TaxID=43759 RepID=UPI001FD74D81